MLLHKLHLHGSLIRCIMGRDKMIIWLNLSIQLDATQNTLFNYLPLFPLDPRKSKSRLYRTALRSSLYPAVIFLTGLSCTTVWLQITLFSFFLKVFCVTHFLFFAKKSRTWKHLASEINPGDWGSTFRTRTGKVVFPFLYWCGSQPAVTLYPLTRCHLPRSNSGMHYMLPSPPSK